MSKILAKARAYADACVAECNENFGNSEPADNAMRELVAEIASFEQPQPKQSEPNNDEVICPNCCTQFRAIPVNVQQLMLAAGFEPPFTAPPLREPEQSEPDWKKPPEYVPPLVKWAQEQTAPPLRELSDGEIRDMLEAEFLGSDKKRDLQDDLRVARAVLKEAEARKAP